MNLFKGLQQIKLLNDVRLFSTEQHWNRQSDPGAALIFTAAEALLKFWRKHLEN